MAPNRIICFFSLTVALRAGPYISGINGNTSASLPGLVFADAKSASGYEKYKKLQTSQTRQREPDVPQTQFRTSFLEEDGLPEFLEASDIDMHDSDASGRSEAALKNDVQPFIRSKDLPIPPVTEDDVDEIKPLQEPENHQAPKRRLTRVVEASTPKAVSLGLLIGALVIGVLGIFGSVLFIWCSGRVDDTESRLLQQFIEQAEEKREEQVHLTENAEKEARAAGDALQSGPVSRPAGNPQRSVSVPANQDSAHKTDAPPRGAEKDRRKSREETAAPKGKGERRASNQAATSRGKSNKKTPVSIPSRVAERDVIQQLY